MNPHRLLRANALSTAACAVVMLAARDTLSRMFGLESPFLLDVLAIGLLAYAAALALTARVTIISRGALLAFAAADAAWVAGSAVVLVAFWSQFTWPARLLVIAVGLVVEMFATLQFRVATRSQRGTLRGSDPQPA